MLVWQGHRAELRSLAFAPDGRSIATTAGNSKFVWLWESTTGKRLRKLSGPDIPMRYAAFTPDGQHVIGLHEYRQASVWHTETGVKVATLEPGTWLYNETLALKPDGSLLTLHASSEFLEWDDPAMPTPGTRRHNRARPLELTHAYPFAMGYSPTGRFFWTTGGGLALFDGTTYAFIQALIDDDNAMARTVAFTPDESRACVAFGHRETVWKFDDLSAPPVKLRGHKQQVRTVGFLPGGGTVLTAAMDGTVRLWDANSGTELRSFDWGIGKVRVAAVSPDGTMCAAGSDDGQLVVWDVDL